MRLVSLLCVLLALAACSGFGAGGPSFLVYFPERSAKLDAEAQKVVAAAANRAKDQPTAGVDVVGYTDSAGSPQADVLLSQQRARNVADALVANGVAANRVVRSGRGQTGGDPGLASRRVEIDIAGS